MTETSDPSEELDSDDEESFTDDEEDRENDMEVVGIVSGGKVINFTHSRDQVS